MDTTRYRAFVAATELGTVKGAAEQLGYTPSAVSQLIHALEEDLDTTLLVRSRHGVTLTPGGKTLLPIARNILLEEEQLYQTAAELNGLLRGTLTITAYPSIATDWMPEIIRRYREKYPAITLLLHEGTWEEMYQRVEERSVDIAFIAEAAGTPYDWIPLAKDPLLAFLPLTHPLAKADKYPVSRLSQEDVVAISEFGRDHEISPILSKVGASWENKFVTKGKPTLLAMVSKGMCMTVTNSMGTVSWGDQVASLPLDPPLSETIGALVPSKEQLSPAARRFLDVVIDTLRENGLYIGDTKKN